VTFVGAGDIASAGDGDEATARLLDGIPGTVFTIGDNVYQNGTLAEFNAYYTPTWGRHKSRTIPVVGNHEYNTGSAQDYFTYFGAAAGDPTKGYYSTDLGAWHIVVINSNCSVVSCAAGSAQEQWLRADLAAHPALCTVALYHHPRFSSGSSHGNSTTLVPIWNALYDGNVDLVLNGHDHDYERFARQDRSGVADPVRGIQEIVVGTGGVGANGFGTVQPNSQVRSTVLGVMQLTLKTTSYDFRFVPVAGQTFTDAGSGTCH
jgi:acid phosphatase type 7